MLESVATLIKPKPQTMMASMHNNLKALLFSLAILANAGHAMEISVDQTSSGSIFSGGLDIFGPEAPVHGPLDAISFYDFDQPCMPSQCGSWRSRGYTLFDDIPAGFTVQSAALELDISSMYFFPFFFMGNSFPNGSGALTVNLFHGALVEALRILPEGELASGETANSDLRDAGRQFATRSFLRSSELSTGIVRFDFNQAVLDALNENSGPLGVSLELSGVLEGFVSLRNPGRLILEGDFSQVPLPAPLQLLLCSFVLLALQRRALAQK